MLGSVGNLPLDWVQVNVADNVTSPSTTHCSNNLLVDYLTRYLLQRVMSVFKFTIPESVDERYFKYVLFCNGYIVLTYNIKYGAIAYYGALTGTDMYYRPKKATLTLNDSDTTTETINVTLIGEKPNGVLMTLQENYSSILDLVYFYAERIALLFEAFDVNVINSKLAYVFGTDSKSMSETFKSAYDDIAGGQPAVVIDKDMFDEDGKPKWQAFFNNLRANYIGSDLMIDINKCIRDFDTQIGIPNANTDKRERVTTDEVNSNNVEAVTRVEMWVENMNKCFTRIGEMFKDWSDCKVELRVPDTDFFEGQVNDSGTFEDNTNRYV